MQLNLYNKYFLLLLFNSKKKFSTFQKLLRKKRRMSIGQPKKSTTCTGLSLNSEFGAHIIFGFFFSQIKLVGRVAVCNLQWLVVGRIRKVTSCEGSGYAHCLGE